jgi:hypothetical protein
LLAWALNLTIFFHVLNMLQNWLTSKNLGVWLHSFTPNGYKMI